MKGRLTRLVFWLMFWVALALAALIIYALVWLSPSRMSERIKGVHFLAVLIAGLTCSTSRTTDHED